ncbi:DNA helicase RecQ [Thorsellia anophelis]|uniref:DNA helicase RecQ n=1 Tax=Thorsellia anophelis TaxID=336804 RepID=UPI001FE1E814|nr:DNA helicase RecQ [Thorsellia anophelis]
MDSEIKKHAISILTSIFGYNEFRTGQFEIIKNVITKQDSLVIMPTGGGKSLCYQIPALMLDGFALIVSPLISLMKDQVDQLRINGVKAACYNSAMTKEEQFNVMQECKQGRIKLLYVSPERLMSDFFLSWLKQMPISFVAVDEAHCISQWGHDFRPEYRLIGQLKAWLGTIPIMGLTATADEVTRNDIITKLALQNPLVSISSFDRPNIRYVVVDKNKPIDQLIRLIKQQQGKHGIVYCGSRKKTEEIAGKLSEKGISADFYHAGLELEKRFAVQEAFQRDDLQVVVATVAFGMGINKSNVRFVVHYDIPRNIESYYQETGRAGRDGVNAEAILFYEPRDIVWLRQVVEEKPDDIKPIEKHKLNAMAAFAESLTCRRVVLLNYFGENRQEPCGNCDICLSPPKKYDGLVDAQKVLSAIYKTGQRFGLNYISEILRGEATSRNRERGHDKLTVFGIGKTESDEHWLSVMRQLIHQGYIVQNPFSSFAMQLTEASRPILRAEQQLFLAKPRLAIETINSKTKFNKKDASQNQYDDRSVSYDKALFAKLKHMRKKIADEQGCAPYMILNDKTLIEISHIMPTTLNELRQISGIGDSKLSLYGDLLISQIKKHLSR